MCVYKSRVHTYYGVKVFWDKKYGYDLVMLKKVNIKIDLVNAITVIKGPLSSILQAASSVLPASK